MTGPGNLGGGATGGGEVPEPSSFLLFAPALLLLRIRRARA